MYRRLDNHNFLYIDEAHSFIYIIYVIPWLWRIFKVKELRIKIKPVWDWAAWVKRNIWQELEKFQIQASELESDMQTLL